MSLLIQCAPSRWADFLTISDNALPTHSGVDADLFVGKDIRVTLTFPNGTETRFRDVVVLGELVLKSSDPENLAVKPRIVARDFFAPGNLTVHNIALTCNRLYQPKNLETFRSELQELLMNWLDNQRESVARIGLKSVLV